MNFWCSLCSHEDKQNEQRFSPEDMPHKEGKYEASGTDASVVLDTCVEAEKLPAAANAGSRRWADGQETPATTAPSLASAAQQEPAPGSASTQSGAEESEAKAPAQEMTSRRSGADGDVIKQEGADQDLANLNVDDLALNATPMRYQDPDQGPPKVEITSSLLKELTSTPLHRRE